MKITKSITTKGNVWHLEKVNNTSFLTGLTGEQFGVLELIN